MSLLIYLWGAFPAILVDSWGLRPEYRGTFAGRHVCFQEMSVAERVDSRLVHGSCGVVSLRCEPWCWHKTNFWVAFLDPSLRESTWSSKINLFQNCWLHGVGSMEASYGFSIFWIGERLKKTSVACYDVSLACPAILAFSTLSPLAAPSMAEQDKNWWCFDGAGMVGCFGHPTFGHRERNILWTVATSYTTMGWLKAHFWGW